MEIVEGRRGGADPPPGTGDNSPVSDPYSCFISISCLEKNHYDRTKKIKKYFNHDDCSLYLFLIGSVSCGMST